MWQDYYFAAAGLLYTVVLIPAMLDPGTEMTRSSSVLTAATLASSATVYGTMGMWFASASCLLASAQWSWLAVYRPVRKKPW